MKATEKYFTLVPFIVVYTLVLTFDYVDENLKCEGY